MDTNFCNACPTKVKGKPELIAERVWRCPVCGNIEDYTCSSLERVRALMQIKDQIVERRMYGAWSGQMDTFAMDREIICVLGLVPSSVPVPA